MADSRRSKRHALKRHAKQRAFERYGIELNDSDLNELAKRVRTAKIVFEQSRRVTVRDVRWKGKKMRVVFDHDRQVPVTFLNLDMDPSKKHTKQDPDDGKPWMEFPKALFHRPHPGKRVKKKKVIEKKVITGSKRSRRRKRGREC